ncbi:multidrug ABC transporter permease [Catellatospora sp. TT07R-123]|uniref:ABC transporter ATP-binding protein n=1 Tax=Catellatospora sp. TT07R-123 TaxID=2733863 RepID=UPI001B1D164E|nr:multidrug ABC transporter permease [Catellatospora sp. TT07R-123]
MTATATGATTSTEDPDPAAPAYEPALPELRAMWWESGMRARADAGLFAIFTELPRLVATAVGISWSADRARTIVVGAATFASGAMATFGLLATQRVLVGLFSAGPTADRVTAALPALIALAVATAARAGLGIASGYAQNGLTPRVDRAVERKLFETTTAVRLDAFDQDAFADDVERASRGTDAAMGLVQGTMNLLAGVVSLLAVTVAVIVIHPLLLVALLVATVPNAWAALKAGHQRYQTYVAGSVRRRRLWILHHLMADRQTAAELRSYDLRQFLLGQYDQVMEVETRIQLDLARKVTTTTSIGSLIGGMASGSVYALLGWLLLDGQIPLAAAATCVVALQAAARSLSTVTFHVDRLYTDGRHFGDYTGLMRRAADHLPDTSGATPPEPLRELRVEAVSLVYPDRDTRAVDAVTLAVQAGQTVAFVGENGSGKSTLAAMIAGLRFPSEGVLRWNGVPLAELDAAELRGRVAVVTQDYHKWPFTAATNIALGDIAGLPGRKRIKTAAGRAAAHEMIVALPHGYETLLDRTFAQGQDLSGGQWQRITAARGFLRDAELLIMDEPSSALDPRAEDALFQALRDRQGHRTTILITHRLANVRHADRIFVMHDGALIESGTHDELMARPARYAELFTLQAAGYQA